MKCLEGESEADISDLHNLFVWSLNVIFVIQIQSPWKIHSLIKFDTNSHLMCLLSQSKSKFESKVQFDFIDNFSMPSDLKNWLDAADWIYINCYCNCMTVATIHLQRKYISLNDIISSETETQREFRMKRIKYDTKKLLPTVKWKWSW